MKHQHKKRFGQNFIKDQNLIKKIVKLANIEEKDILIEVGPGEGALTNEILKLGNKLTSYEIDKSLKEKLLKIKEVYPNFNIYFEDFLSAVIDSNANYLIGNIPYNITSPIINKFFNSNNLKIAYLMVQKEFGLRLTASPKTKDYNALSVITKYLTKSSLVLNVSRKMFYPVPKVDSVVVKLVKKDIYIEEELILFISNIFKQKRKTLKNNLVNSYNVLKVDVDNFFNTFSIKETIRAEELEVDEIILIGKNWLKQFKNKEIMP